MSGKASQPVNQNKANQEMSLAEAYDLATEWILETQSKLENHQWKVLSNHWETDPIEFGEIFISRHEGNSIAHLHINYDPKDPRYSHLKAGDEIRLKVRDDENSKSSVRNRIHADQSCDRLSKEYLAAFIYICELRSSVEK